VYADGTAYTRGQLVTKAGGLWIALNGTADVPGQSPHWKLIAKSGGG
jgi:hypothetical protein